MPVYDKPLPQPTKYSHPYWDACKRHVLALQHCTDCGIYRFYPRPLCPNCNSARFNWDEVSGRGVVYTFTEVHRAIMPGFAEELPIIVAIIELENGVRMMSNIVECEASEVAIDCAVEVIFHDVTEEITLPKFRLSR